MNELERYRGARTKEEMARLYNVSPMAWGYWERRKRHPNAAWLKEHRERIERDSGRPWTALFYDD